MITVSATAALNLLDRFKSIRNQSERICAPLLPEDTVVQPMVDVSPPKWHLAHTSWFFETFLLQPILPGYGLFHPQYSFLFNSYYNSVGNRVLRAERGTLTRPALADIYRYRRHVDEAMAELLNHLGTELPPEVAPVLELGLQHEQQHQELLVTDIKYILSTNPLLPAYQPAPALMAPASASVPGLSFLEVPGGFYEIGYGGDGFCFDNEKKVHQVYLPDFRLADRLVTNGEFLAFMEDGGYRDFRHWLGEGFELATQQQWEAPLYWLQQEGQWFRYTLHGLEPVNPAAPVCHVSFYEADAFANWAGKRLLTEFEWEAATQVYPPAKEQKAFSESGRFDPRPLPYPVGKTQTCRQLLGEVWEWTYSAYHPYPGFSKAPGALGEYNGKFMINQMVLRGGSCATPLSHIRPTYRNFFHPDKRWQFTGIRLAEKP